MRKFIALVVGLLSGSADAQTDLPGTLAAIDQQLKDKRPDLAASLQTPLSMDQIADLERTFAVRLPDDVKALYLWHDGQDPSDFTTFANNMQFQPLRNMLETKAELDGMIGYDFELENWWHPAWLPIFQNGGGDYIALDTLGVHTGDAGQLIRVYHDWEHRPIVARSLSVFMHGMGAYLDVTAPRDMDEFHAIEDFLPANQPSFKASGAAKPLR